MGAKRRGYPGADIPVIWLAGAVAVVGPPPVPPQATYRSGRVVASRVLAAVRNEVYVARFSATIATTGNGESLIADSRHTWGRRWRDDGAGKARGG